MAPKSTKPHQFRNLTFTDHRPKFLENINAALRGAKAEEPDHRRYHRGEDGEETEVLDPSRPAIPVRPRGNRDDDEDDDDDEQPQVVDDNKSFGMGRLSDEEEEEEGDEDAPEVVVLKEGKHLTKEEFEAEKIRLRDHPDVPSTLPTSSRKSIKPSLTFSSSNKQSSTSTGKRKATMVDIAEKLKKDDWSELVERTKGGKSTLVSTIQEEREIEEKASMTKKQKRNEIKAKNKKAKSLMSFS
ncbi:hypothetical protein PCASD_04473 [Puccinia coronata f. sp. avenae]|uniref:DUF4604 domain-containing protein n=1 Tax=Puccinia coronata f. sp. avenae TaxID=200324 RepID=A0A2N5V2Y5_9BASI|nr:hypothetical protein PCASD_04473 [Puccinia coronata f. sp. avenae]